MLIDMKTQVLKFTTKVTLTWIALVCLGLLTSLSFAQQKDARTIIEGYAEDYQNDVTFKKDVTFAVKVDDTFWHVKAIAKTEESEAKVTVHDGKPEQPSFYFFTDLATLNKIDKGEMNALTGAAKAFSSDYAPFDADVMEDFNPDQNFFPTLMSVYFHFWTKGLPERIPYGLDLTRFTHGAQASIFYYQPGFRSGYVAVKKGQHANEDENSKTNPFPTLLIAIKGEGKMIINGAESVLSVGEAVLIPAGVKHEFLNENEEPLECILLMFGDGA
jgi:mannose-6-phosphate isomerase-like protein (cupin superfamily)